MALLYKHMENTLGAIALILRRESKIPSVKLVVLLHSACPSKNYAPKCSQFPHKLGLQFFFLQAGTHSAILCKCMASLYKHMGKR